MQITPWPFNKPTLTRRNLKLTKLITKTTIKFLGYLSLLLAASNPPKTAYIDYKTNQLFNTIQTPITNQCTNLPPQLQGVCQTSINTLSTGVNITQSDKLERYISGATNHHNYILFSTYEIKAEGLPSNKTLGILGQFIPIQSR